MGRGVFKTIRKRIASRFSPIDRQRYKTLKRMGGYWPILKIKQLSFRQRIRLIWNCLRIDWHVQHGHRPGEIAFIFHGLANKRAQPGEIMVEAGCWNGGSSAKFSILCEMLGYMLHIYDSFQGVEPVDPETYDFWYVFSGEYSASQESVRQNIETYGKLEVCEFFRGWFSETMAPGKLKYPVRIVYLDCDLSKGTFEALQGVLPQLTQDGIIYSQDYHIQPIREMLENPNTWKRLNYSSPKIELGYHHTVALRFNFSAQPQ